VSGAAAIVEAARATLALNIYPVPILPGTKRPPMTAWQNLRLGLDDLEQHFSDGYGLGWQLGITPRPIADVDLDCPEALAVVPHIEGPKTQRVAGHRSNPGSHHFFELPDECGTAKFQDPLRAKSDGKKMVVELRGKGCQTVVPPSTHPETGERYEWTRSGNFGKTTYPDLLRWASKVAAAALLTRYWNARVSVRLALIGMLARAEWPEEETREFVEAVIRAADPDDLGEVGANVTNCYHRVDGDKKSYGRSTLEELLGENGKLVVATAAGWLEIRSERESKKKRETCAEIELESFAEVKMEKVAWLWPGKIALGKLNLFVGNPEQGKSLVSLDAAARVTFGASWPDGTPGSPAETLIVSCEDDPNDTVAPRLSTPPRRCPACTASRRSK
jgi:hypothetical protein